MDFVYDEATLDAAARERALLDQLFELEQDILFAVISHLHHYLYNTVPNHMKNWQKDQLVSWFEQTYEWDSSSDEWKARVAKH